MIDSDQYVDAQLYKLFGIDKESQDYIRQHLNNIR